MTAWAITSLAPPSPRPFSSLLHPDCNKYHYAEASSLPGCCLHLEKVRWCKGETEGTGCLSYLYLDTNGALEGRYASTVTDSPLCRRSTLSALKPELSPSFPHQVLLPQHNPEILNLSWMFLWPPQSVCWDSFYVSLSRSPRKHPCCEPSDCLFHDSQPRVFTQQEMVAKASLLAFMFWLKFCELPEFQPHLCQIINKIRPQTQMKAFLWARTFPVHNGDVIHVSDSFNLFLR